MIDVPVVAEYSVVIDAPYELVWKITNDVASWTDLFPAHESVEILHREGDTTRFRITKRPDEQGRVLTWVSDRTVDREAGEARAVRVETGPFAYMRLRWGYLQVPEGVRLSWRYEFTMKPDSPYGDAQMKAHFDESAPAELEQIKGRIEARVPAEGSAV
ncbi:aromatase [Nocardiopsis flavescens]|uniref:Aromatase n=1 Tax=Nocardiopsis flavescens TaxID=758803 RepID=A0A1M6IPU6_9ACTN|nr:SRPBCC family protein [Nocardiopsis flavescens]SHJ36447.1 aromatase [Nocardiopsis flavescens]